MFKDLYDEISKLWSWRWPVALRQVVLVEIERVRHANSSRDTLRLSVVYSFWVNDEGPYGGEGFWTPAFSFGAVKKLREARRKLRVGRCPLSPRRPKREQAGSKRLERALGGWSVLQHSNSGSTTQPVGVPKRNHFQIEKHVPPAYHLS